MCLKRDELPPFMAVSREDLLSNGMSNLHLLEPLRLPSTDLDEDPRYSYLSEEDGSDDLKEQKSHTSLNEFENENKPSALSETPDKLISKSVSFVVTEASQELKPREFVPTRSVPRRKISGRRSVSPVNFASKVVPVLDSPSDNNSYGQRLHPSSALKIYALAKTRQRTGSGLSLVSRPRVKQRSFVKHNTSEISIGRNFTMNDGIDRDIGRIPKTFVDIPSHGWEPQTVMDRQGDEVMAGTVKDKERRREKKDLIGWCINALSEKAKYPIFSPKPRLRSQRSMLKDEGKVYSYCQ